MVSKRQKSNVRRQIDENLKRVYDEALNEKVPDKFLALIAKLKEGEAKPDDD
ncbi:NepR family anti-sigma factor [Ovoidimarina sediminis]|uniref:NepR family anti-sigma factor n=1 Tax=Ovoidimarina sediminis TaxID=3079856 RepID=UPI00292F69EA|nr:NepR family anti-sigma factor [Rhodophyticola sp. MJ-SS7]